MNFIGYLLQGMAMSGWVVGVALVLVFAAPILGVAAGLVACILSAFDKDEEEDEEGKEENNG